MLPDLPESLLKTLLRPLTALLFEAANEDLKAAWDGAVDAVSVFNPQTTVELRLAIRVCIFNILGNQSLAEASNKEIPIDRMLRLQNGALALVRAADKAELRLEERRAARVEGQDPTDDPEELTETDSPRIENAIALLDETKVITAQAAIHGVTWKQAYKQRNLEKRLAKRQERAARTQAQSTGLPPSA
jgi:hypothetical protein